MYILDIIQKIKVKKIYLILNFFFIIIILKNIINNL